MNKLFAVAAVAMTLAVAGPAAADVRPGVNGRGGMDSRIELRIDNRIDQGVRNGRLTRNEALMLRASFRDLQRLEARYSRNGLSRVERADLARRYERLEAQITFELNDRERARHQRASFDPTPRR